MKRSIIFFASMVIATMILAQNVGINNPVPDSTLDVTGSLRVSGPVNLELLGGNTTQMVVSDTSGNLSVQPIPTSTTYTSGIGIDISGSTITNVAPDQLISLTDSGATTVSGIYPNFTISSTDLVNDADADPTNELQTLSLVGNTLILSNGDSIVLNLVPVGTVQAFAGDSVPNGWLLCDGSAVSRSTYTELFAVVEGNFGIGDGVNTFHLPDLRGRFVRGVDHGTGRDPHATSRDTSQFGGNMGDAVGSVQNDTFESHTHSANSNVNDPGHSHSMGANVIKKGSSFRRAITGSLEFSSNYVTGTQSSGTGISVSTSVGSTGSLETRPKNLYLNYIIKY